MIGTRSAKYGIAVKERNITSSSLLMIRLLEHRIKVMQNK
jgi:hypothetical protein